MKKLLILVLFLISAAMQMNGQSKKQRIDSLMRSYHRFNMFDGAVLVAENGKVIYKNAFGFANREWNIANTTDTKFMIGSVSKPLTAMLVLMQVQKGLINLDKTISDYLPEFSETNGRRITIRQLLSHTSGMPNYEITPDFFPLVSRKFFSREEYIKIYMDSALLFEPGTNYSYSSWGYYTLGYILEKLSGRSYSQLMKEEIFDKTGMTGSGSYYHTQIVPKRATGYDYSIDGYKTGDFRDQSNTMGTGDLYSTVEDLFKFHIALTENKLLNKELTKEMFTGGIRPWQYGYGWFNQYFRYTPTDSIFANYHLGTTEGFLSFFIRIPETNSLVVFLCNSYPTDFFGIAGNLLKLLHNKTVKLKQPVHKLVASTITKKGIDAAIRQYDELKKDTAHYYVEWWNMDQLGHQLYDLTRYQEALRIFEKNAQDFPTRDIALVSLAQVYEILGRKEEAISYYKKAIGINENNEEAKNRLNRLQKN